MEISLAGIEQAVEGLGYRSDKSPKSRLVYTLKKHYYESGAVESVNALDTDALIDRMWDLNGDETAIRSKRKNLSSIKSSVNADLNGAWELGRNPEGITIGPLNTFVMSDAAKDKILNSFSGAMNLDGGNTLDRVTEALKIVSEYLANLPGGLEDDKLSNLKSLVEGLAEKFRDGGPGEFEIVEKKTDGSTGVEERFEDGDLDASDEIELLDEEEIVEDEDDDADLLEDETEIEELAEEDSDDYEEAIEDDLEALESDDTEIIEVMEKDGSLDASDEVELVDEEEILEDDGEDAEALEDDTEIEEFAKEELDDIEEVLDEDEAEFFEDDSESDDENRKDDVGLPLDQFAEDALNFEEFRPDEEQKRLLAERFDGYLGAMERYYNQYIIIKKGRYTVGADDTETDVLNEQTVSLPDYYVGKYPVTNALFEVFIERTGYKTTAEKLGYGYVYQSRFQKTVDPVSGLSRSTWNPSYTRKKVDGATWYQPMGPGSTLHQKRNHPVVQVGIKDARTFAAWTGKRLPTEIEWEAAARTRSGFIYPWGNEWRDGLCNSESSGLSDTSPVDAYPRGNNEAGLAGLLGNVLEWTADECEPKYPLEKPARFFIAKSGSWVSHEKTRLFERTRFEADFTANTVGFRCLAD